MGGWKGGTDLARADADGAEGHHHGEGHDVELALAEGEDGGELRFLCVEKVVGGCGWEGEGGLSARQAERGNDRQTQTEGDC